MRRCRHWSIIRFKLKPEPNGQWNLLEWCGNCGAFRYRWYREDADDRGCWNPPKWSMPPKKAKQGNGE